LSSILLPRSAAVPAERGVASPLMPVSVLAHWLCEQSSPAPTNMANVSLAEDAGRFQASYKYLATMHPSTFPFDVFIFVSRVHVILPVA